MRKTMHKRFVALSVALVLGALPVSEALARVGSPTASARSVSSAPRAATPVSVGRVGGGQSIGMARPDVMARVKQSPPAAKSNTNSNSGSTPYVAAAPTPEAPKKRSWVAPALAGVVAGGVAGYALADSHNTAPAPQAPVGQYVPQAPQYSQQAQQYAPQPQYAPQEQSVAPAYPANRGYVAAPTAQPVQPASSGGFGFGSFLVLLALLGGGYLVYRKMKGDNMTQAKATTGRSAYSASVAPKADDANDLQVIARRFFEELQVLNNKGDLAELKKRLTPEMFEILGGDIRERTAASQTTVVSVTPTLVDSTNEGHQDVASIHYAALISESPEEAPEKVEEVWHFVKTKGTSTWLLAGIEGVGA